MAVTDEELAAEVLTESRRQNGCEDLFAKTARYCCSYHEGMADGLDIFLDRRSKGA